MAVGAPGSNDDNGFVYVYSKQENTSSFSRAQIIPGNLVSSGDRFGSSVSLDEFGDWLYVGAPASDRVYIYGLNKNIPSESQVTSINTRNVIKISSNLLAISSATVGDHLKQYSTGADVEIIAIENAGGGVSNVVVSSLTNITTGSGNLSLVTVNFYGDPTTITDLPTYPTATYSTSYRTSIDLQFTPAVEDDANSLLVTSRSRTYIPNIDYVLDGTTINFITNGNIALPAYIEQNDISITQGPYYTYVTEIQGSAGSEFGYCVDSSLDGAQLGIGAPGQVVNVAVFSDGVTTVERSIPVGINTANVTVDGNVLTRQSYVEHDEAGAVYVYDRVIEAFNSTGNQDYTTIGALGDIYRVTIDGVEVTDYFKVDANTIRFVTPPDVGRIVYIETNQFNLLETLIGIDSLTGGLTAIQSGARFGTSLTICSNNCAFYIGAPYYDNGTTYNTGAVWKFHNRGRLYGTNTGYVKNPTFTPGDTIRLDNFEITLTGTTLDDLVEDINGANILGVNAVNENGYLFYLGQVLCTKILV
jgi:hypothetical protein